jgi:hypothetical protein
MIGSIFVLRVFTPNEKTIEASLRRSSTLNNLKVKKAGMGNML